MIAVWFDGCSEMINDKPGNEISLDLSKKMLKVLS
jgi:hypothetical protein